MAMEKTVFQSALGYMAYAQQGHTLLALVFGHPSEQSALKALERRTGDLPCSAESPCDESLEPGGLVRRLQNFADGEPTDFSDVPVDASGTTEFQHRVIAGCRAIPWGETRSYGQLARNVGRPGAARAVGSVMAANRVPLVVPCHRVVAASGALGGFSAPQGTAMKSRLLAAEQCECSWQRSHAIG